MADTVRSSIDTYRQGLASPGPFLARVINNIDPMRQGSLEVELKDGKKHTFKQGDAFAEVINKLHRGHNLSKETDVELIVFYAGIKDKPNTIEENKDNCSH